jgi:hypothetical protein
MKKSDQKKTRKKEKHRIREIRQNEEDRVKERIKECKKYRKERKNER